LKANYRRKTIFRIAEDAGGYGKGVGGRERDVPLASNVGSGAVDRLEDGRVLSDVAGGRESESTDETGAHVRENVTVELWVEA
jgi:hypothetical protein